MNRKVFIIAVLALSVLTASVFSAQAARPMRVVYGFDREFPPFSFEDPGGKPVGFEVELIEAVFSNSAALVMRPLQWRIIPTELASGAVSITSGMVRTEERSKIFSFSTLPSFLLQVRLFTKVYNRYPNATFLRGQRVAVEQGAYPHRLAENFGGMNIKTFTDKISPIKALYNDEVEAYCGPVQSAYYYMNKLGYGGISTLGTPLGITELRFAVNRERGDILRALNEGLRRLHESGEYNRIYRKWFVRDLNEDENLKLRNAAKEATLASYTPYGRATRGAAVLTATGQIYRGSAVENAEHSLSVSALTSAVVAAVGAGDLEIRAALVVDADGKPVQMSRNELQILYEFGRGVLAVTFDADENFSASMVGELLPNPVVAAAGPAGRK